MFGDKPCQVSDDARPGLEGPHDIGHTVRTVQWSKASSIPFIYIAKVRRCLIQYITVRNTCSQLNLASTKLSNGVVLIGLSHL